MVFMVCPTLQGGQDWSVTTESLTATKQPVVNDGNQPEAATLRVHETGVGQKASGTPPRYCQYRHQKTINPSSNIKALMEVL